MGRKKSFSSIMRDIAREQARQERERQKAERARQRDIERAKRETARLAKEAEKEVKQRYLEARMAEVEESNIQLQDRLEQLNSILEHTLSVDDTISFDSLRLKAEFKPFSLPAELQDVRTGPDREAFFANVKKPGRLGSMIPGAEQRYQEATQRAEASYEAAMREYEAEMALREARIDKRRSEYEAGRQAFQEKVQQRNQEVDELESGYIGGDPDAVCTYCGMVLERSEYPDGFPQEFRLAFVPESKELVIDYELPNVDIIPTVAEYQYVKTRDSIQEKGRKSTETKSLYQDIVASVCLRTVHEVFEADQGNNLDVVVFNGFTQTVDPATGNDIRPYLISIRTTKDRFNEINLGRIDKRACLRNLGAQVSPRPDQMLAVKPVVEFDMVDRRFVEQSDVLSDLESRPNLMELTPFEFENLVSNLFAQLGFRTEQTRSSRDGGIDAVAFDTRPILGGKVVIQAKRYKNVVGVSAVRDLYGTMINEGANKGILVTTSHYGPDAYDFAKDKPIELIDGGGLLYLLEENGVEARIVFPED